MIKAVIIGATGYAGGELVRLLLNHKEVEIKWYGSRSYIDKKYYEVYQNHSDWCDTVLTQAEELVQAYAGVDPQVIESGEIRTMSKTRLIVLLEGSYRQNES